MISQQRFDIPTRGRGTYEITRRVDEAVRASGIRTGLCHLFVQHTSASLILCENADPTVRQDLETFLVRLVPDGDRAFDHRRKRGRIDLDENECVPFCTAIVRALAAKSGFGSVSGAFATCSCPATVKPSARPIYASTVSPCWQTLFTGFTIAREDGRDDGELADIGTEDFMSCSSSWNFPQRYGHLEKFKVPVRGTAILNLPTL